MARQGFPTGLWLTLALAVLVLGSRGAAAGSRRLAQKGTQAAQPCAALDETINSAFVDPELNLAFVRPLDVLQCSRTSVPFNRTAAFQDLQSVSLYLKNFYSLIHLARRSPNPGNLPSEWDVLAELAKLRNRTWLYSDDFYQEMASVIDRLNDGHTGIDYSPYVSAYYRLALPLVAVREGGKPVVRVAPAVLAADMYQAVASQAPFEFQASKYYGAAVARVEGVPAWAYMLAWATGHSGVYHNLGQRLNEAFASFSQPGAFAERTANPGTDFVTMVLQRVNSKTLETVRVPWIAAVDLGGYPFGSEQSLATARKAKSAVATTVNSFLQYLGVAASLKKGPMMRREKIPQKFLKKRRPSKFKALANQAQSTNAEAVKLISSPSDLWAVYKLSDGKTGVLAVSTFLVGDDNSNPLYWKFLSETSKALTTLKENNCSLVIIDLSGNPGGFTQFGYWFVQLIVGLDAFAQKAGGQEPDYWRYLADTSFVQDLVRGRSNLFDYEGWANASQQRFSKADAGTFFYPVREATFGPSGFPGKYSNTFKDTDNPIQNWLGPNLGAPALGNRKVVLLSDGGCFSTCGTVSHTLRRRFRIPLVTVGGIPSSPMAFSAGAGGFVTGDVEASLFEYFPATLRSNSDAPKEFVGPISMGMRLAAGFFNQLLVAPLEFTFLGADFRVFHTMDTVASPGSLYSEVAKLFK